jgi:hypothetical protein
MVGTSCFAQYENLQYFEFPDSLRQICPLAFTKTTLENTTIGGINTTYIGISAFNQAITDGENHRVYLPGSVNILDCNACSYSGRLSSGWQLIIGGPDDYSYLDLSKYSGSPSDHHVFD